MACFELAMLADLFVYVCLVCRVQNKYCFGLICVSANAQETKHVALSLFDCLPHLLTCMSHFQNYFLPTNPLDLFSTEEPLEVPKTNLKSLWNRSFHFQAVHILKSVLELSATLHLYPLSTKIWILLSFKSALLSFPNPGLHSWKCVFVLKGRGRCGGKLWLMIFECTGFCIVILSSY